MAASDVTLDRRRRRGSATGSDERAYRDGLAVLVSTVGQLCGPPAGTVPRPPVMP